MEIVISNAPFNRAAALSLRQATFVTERGIPRDVEFDDRDTPERLYVVAYQRAELPVGTLRLEPQSDTQMRFGRGCTSQTVRGQGIGSQVLQAGENWATAHGFAVGIIDGELTAKTFYERCGYHVVGEPFTEDGAPVVTLTKNL
ncbi:GNAT family N-acetyltransferase [Levilactobacillus fujinensis]|uniref:GNAT family N-acetyltransferase n=1 Tax=Levilactobacillus fujinensis TaxID=2486024 RepID=A0ABW1TJQ3_9LACO|nr:GNAT family N-acetyltransferase [Levilactobacillus fujinensis]